MGRRLALALAAAVALLASGAAAEAATPALRCGKQLLCRTVTVALDRTGAVPGTLQLPVKVQRGEGPVLLALGGGPGQGMASGFGVELIPMLHQMSGMRVAVIDQRGTGATALRCGAMQRADLSDLTVPPGGAVGRCAAGLGERRAFYDTTATVADLDAIRQALGLDRWALLGVSYGTYVAERYARAHPDRVTRLVLDSVVPQTNVDPFFANSLRRSALVLRQLCVRGSLCRESTSTPVADLRRLVRRTDRRPLRGYGVTIDGPALFDLITTLASLGQANFVVFPTFVHRALNGDPDSLLRLAAAIRGFNAGPADVLSLGLHTATLCSDVAWPWGGPNTPPSVRRDSTTAAARRLPADLGPFDRATAAGNGALVTCLRWPQTPVAAPPAPGPLPAVPTLLLAGTWDLSTPLEDAREEARRSPTAQLAVLPQVGHSTLTSTACARTIAKRFFAGHPLGTPCAGHRAPKRPPA
jgi:pimeloyl-ACP methyl ester carboxylesterase